MKKEVINKKKNSKLKTFATIGSLFIASSSLLSTFIATGCSSSSAIRFANWESYMAPGLMDRLKQSYNVNFPTYATNETIKTKFEGYYDLAVPTAYEVISMKEDGLLKKIDWSVFGQEPFNLYNLDGLNEVPIDNCELDVSNTSSVYNLFAQATQDALVLYENETGLNLLEYSIPYFLQDFSFAYKKENYEDKVTWYKANTDQVVVNLNEITWDDILFTISPSNNNLDNRFRPIGSRPMLGSLDDSRNWFDIARLIETKDEAVVNIDVLQKDETSLISEYRDTYDQAMDYFSKKNVPAWTYLNTDSGWLSRTLADPNGINAYLGFNGDILYAAAMGAEEFDSYNNDTMEVIKPKYSFGALDLVVINNNLHGDKEKKVYEILYDVLLNGANAPKFDGGSEPWIGYISDDELYYYSSMLNFDYIWYTPVLESIYQFVSSADGSGYEESYWDDPASAQFYIDILQVGKNNNILYEGPLNNLQKSDMHWAYISSKEKL